MSTTIPLKPAREHVAPQSPGGTGDLPPFLEAAEPTSGFADSGLDHVTWAEPYRQALRGFAAASTQMRPAKLVPYDRVPVWLRARLSWERARNGGQRPFGVYTDTWHLPVTAVRDPGLRAEMMLLARAMYQYEFPESGAVILTGMLDDLTPDCSLQLFGWLRSALVDLCGTPSSAVASPTGTSGTPVDGLREGEVATNGLAPHSDLWIPSMLFNYFNEVSPGEGSSQLMPMEQLWPIAAECGMPEDVIEQTKRTLIESGECDYYERFARLLYDYHPWSEELEKRLYAESMDAWLHPGEGYFVSDREWLHGRSGVRQLPAARKQHRIYRLAYNNQRLEAEAGERRMEWDRRGYFPGGCKR